MTCDKCGSEVNAMDDSCDRCWAENGSSDVDGMNEIAELLMKELQPHLDKGKSIEEALTIVANGGIE